MMPTDSVVVILVTVVCILVVLWGFVAIRVRMRETVKLPWMLLVWQLTGAITAGVGAWGVSFATMGEVVADSEKKQLLRTTEYATSRIFDTFNNAALLAEAVAEQFEDRHSALPSYPQSHTTLKGFLRSLPDQSIALVQVGTQEGRYFAVGPWGSGLRLVVTQPPTNKLRRCSEAHCLLLPACTAECSFCETDMGKADGACPGWVPALRADYWMERETALWDVPNMGGNLTHCVQPQEGESNIISSTRLNGERGREWGSSSSCNIRYDPRLRPWYHETGATTWSPVYVFADPGNPLGITVSRPIPNPFYDGTPWNGGTPKDERQSR
eukprot:Hpha_TRINITY_DN9075_c0_g1::TRINITY_DN9075_c0_g1_i1::g.142032::m.142032